jgi:hypothetical protein
MAESMAGFLTLGSGDVTCAPTASERAARRIRTTHRFRMRESMRRCGEKWNRGMMVIC